MALDIYNRVGDFSDDEASNKGGRSSVDTAQLDAELDAIKTVLDQARTMLAAIQRDDLKLTDGLLQGHEFSAAAVSVLGALLATGSLVFRGEWAAATVYAVNDVVSVTGTGAFICVTAHTSPGAFVASPNWQQLAADGAPVAPGGVVDVSSDISIDASHNWKTLQTSGVRTLTLPLASSMADGFTVTIAPTSGVTQIVRSGAETIDGSTAVTITFSSSGSVSLTLQVNAARDGWRVIDQKGAGNAGALVTWNGTLMSQLSPSAMYQELRGNGGHNSIFDGNEIPAAKTANYTVASTDHKDVIRCDASGGAFTVDLLAVAGLTAGFRTTIIKTDASANAVTIDGYTAETINGLASINLSIRYEYVTLLFDGAEWLIIDDGRKTLFGSNTLNLASGASDSFDVAHGFGTDDVDFGIEAYSAASYNTWSVAARGASGHGILMHGSAEPAILPTATVPAPGNVRFSVRNNDSVTRNIHVRYWIRRRTA